MIQLSVGLYELRRCAEDAGFLDKYHGDDKPHWKDDDFFLRLGTFADNLSNNQLHSIESSIRDYLAGRQPVAVEVGVRDISILLYDSPSLEEEHVRGRVPLAAFLRDHSSVSRLYRQLVEQCGTR